MRVLFIYLFPSLLSAQIFSFGVKDGLPLTSTSDFRGSRSFSYSDFEMQRYAFGPTKAKLPFGFRFEADALYQHVRTTATNPEYFTFTATTASAWEIPSLLKRRFGHRTFAPCASVGTTLRRIDDLNFADVHPRDHPFGRASPGGRHRSRRRFDQNALSAYRTGTSLHALDVAPLHGDYGTT